MAERNANGQFQAGHARLGGRTKGSSNVMTREFKDLMESILFDDIEVTRGKLLDLRDSDEPGDRKTFWGLAQKMLPQKIEGDIKGVPTLILDQDFVTGKITEGPAEPDDKRDLR